MMEVVLLMIPPLSLLEELVRYSGEILPIKATRMQEIAQIAITAGLSNQSKS